ncbi:MAG TPA: hypothetical protein VHQ87_06755 [Rhizobacter sp.]|nr:hypothetical protein [Rhizobacter sp.]
MNPLTVYSPSQLSSNDPPDLASAAYRFLAEGDSWFTLSGLNPLKNSNLLFEMEFDQFACAVNCATPGDTLSHMADMSRDPVFQRVLCGRGAYIWDGLLLSCGGNDLIDALKAVGPSVPNAQRLLLPADAWGHADDSPARYLSPEGWLTFDSYLRANLAHILSLRDAGPSAGCPVFIHGYACPTPRNAGAGLGLGPWLMPSLQAHGVPVEDWLPLASLLIKKLGAMLAAIAADSARFPNVHFFDTSAIAITPAALDSGESSGDWVNEIHLTRDGYGKLARPWAAVIEQTVRGH